MGPGCKISISVFQFNSWPLGGPVGLSASSCYFLSISFHSLAFSPANLTDPTPTPLRLALQELTGENERYKDSKLFVLLINRSHEYKQVHFKILLFCQVIKTGLYLHSLKSRRRFCIFEYFFGDRLR